MFGNKNYESRGSKIGYYAVFAPLAVTAVASSFGLGTDYVLTSGADESMQGHIEDIEAEIAAFTAYQLLEVTDECGQALEIALELDKSLDVTDDSLDKNARRDIVTAVILDTKDEPCTDKTSYISTAYSVVKSIESLTDEDYSHAVSADSSTISALTSEINDLQRAIDESSVGKNGLLIGALTGLGLGVFVEVGYVYGVLANRRYENLNKKFHDPENELA